MLLSLNWLREFTPFEGSVQELSDRLTMVGLEVEDIRRPFEGIEKVVLGKVVVCEPHPDADKLTVCQVDVGLETLNIVCGAPNVAEGQIVAVAPIGTVLPGGLKIKKGKIRGVVSEGMICAEDELGLGEDHRGIMVLDSSLKPGTGFVEALALDETVLDVSVTPNRADCMSMLGLAREVGLAFGLPVTIPEFHHPESGVEASKSMCIDIPEPEFCPVYSGRFIEGVRVGPAPDRMRWRLLAIGQRPINNIVDVTNYVMFELGQPLHAFDMDLLEGGKIRVARAEQGMSLTTLDGQKRKLLSSDLLIWDGVKPVALAGVMGGANSEIHAGSSKVFLESAVFRPGTIRKTARRLSLPSEASYRFERGVDQLGSKRALDRAAAMIAAHAGGGLLPGVAQSEPLPWRENTITFRPEKARQLLDLPLDDTFCRTTIEGMGCRVDPGEKEWKVATPSHRLDLEREVDLTEELGRVYGLDRIPVRLPHVFKSLEGIGKGESEYAFWRRIKAWGRGAGLREAVNYSFVGQRDLDDLGLSASNRIPVMNPLSEEQDVLRTTLAPSLLHNLRHNLAQGAPRFRLFELARVYEADEASESTAREHGRLGLLLYGGRHDEVWPRSAGDREEADYADLKGLVEHLLTSLRLGEGTIGSDAAEYALLPDHPWLNPCVEAKFCDGSLGILGRLRPDIAEKYHARKAVWLAELDADFLARLCGDVKVGFAELPKFPPVRRDMTVIAADDLSVGKIFNEIELLRPPLLEEARLIDVFTPEESSERHLTVRLTFRHPSRTLKDKEVDKEREKVANSLVKTLSVRF
jgi:phenylalanyl-tRNA synthetase beta chain